MEKKLETAIAVLVLSLAIVVASCDGNGTEPDADCIDVGGGADAGGDCLPVDGDADNDSDSDGDLEACPAIEIDSVPQGAEVVVNGTPSGTFTPTSFTPPKSEEVELSFLLDGYDPSAVLVRVTASCALSPEGPFVLYPSVEGEDGTLELCYTDSGCREWSGAVIQQDGAELTGVVGDDPVTGTISPTGEITITTTDNGMWLVGNRMSPSLLEGTWSDDRGNTGTWTIEW